MSKDYYTIGLARRFWFTKRLAVTGHKWENFRYIFQLRDGSELSVPGFRAEGVTVYPDIKAYMAYLQDQAAADRLFDEEQARVLREKDELEEFRRMKAAGAEDQQGYALPAHAAAVRDAMGVSRETSEYQQKTAPFTAPENDAPDPADPRYTEEEPEPVRLTSKARENAAARVALLVGH